jgi:2-oxo-4-hydroxy-4-carboxy--5-ureidoimidazoline (OHCU) decarboxylase
MAHPPCIENHVLAVSATKHTTSERALAGLDFQENDEAARFELTYSTL